MLLRHLKTLHLAGEPSIESKLPKVTAISCSPNSVRTAVSSNDRVIVLYDEEGNQKDRIPTKSSISGNKSYQIRALAFSPDSLRLAVAQSDNIVFIYKLGRSWIDKKTICNKYAVTSSVTTLCWPVSRMNDIVYGAADGKVRLGNSANKSITLYSTDSYVVSINQSIDGLSFVSGHLDGSVIKYSFGREGRSASHSLLCRVTFVPLAIAMTAETVIVSGNTNTILVFDHAGQSIQKFDYSRDQSIKEFTSCVMHPSGQTAVLANYDRCVTLVMNMQSHKWEENQSINVKNLYAISAMSWKPDGTRLITGNIYGAVDAFDACLKRYIYKHEYEITYTSLSSLVVRHLVNQSRCSISSKYSLDINQLSIHRNQFVLCKTPETLIVADLLSGLQSEVHWHSQNSGKDRYSWDSEHCCMIYSSGEINVIEYGIDEIVGTARTEFASPHLLSLRINEARNANEGDVRKLAYLLDHQTIRVANLSPKPKPSSKSPNNQSIHQSIQPMNSSQDATISHDHRVDWMELNARGSKLLFRDRQRSLYLYDLQTQSKHVLLHYATYVQWVPNSDVVVAQSRKQLYVWYSIDAMSDVTMIPINGEVEAIVRVSGKSEVIVDEGVRKCSVSLDEPLIAFGSAVDAHDFENAVKILESFDVNSHEVTSRSRPNSGNSVMNQNQSNLSAMWAQLSKLAMNERNFLIAERCFAALGDVSNTAYLHEINAVIAANNGDSNHWLVQAMVCVTNKQFKRAESLYLANGGVEELLSLYQSLHRWSDALRIAEQRQHPSLQKLRSDYFTYLTATKQESLAGDLCEKQGDYDKALKLYLQGNLPAKAADLIVNQGLHSNTSLCDQVAAALITQRQYEKSGEFLISLGQSKRALDCFVKANAYHRAVELARRDFPAQVVTLEQQWAEHLMEAHQYDAAATHFIQCSKHEKALECAILAKQWNKAQQMYDAIDPSTAKQFAKPMAQHFQAVNQYLDAERYWLEAGCASDAVAMYTGASMWDKAHSIAVTYMSEADVKSLYINQSLKLEAAGSFKEAEKLYLTISQAQSAIAMYRKHRLFDDMIRLIAAHDPANLSAAHLDLGHSCENDGAYKQAESHYIAAQEWKAAYTMYKEHSAWEDALRIAKNYGGQEAYKVSAYDFAVSIGGEAGMKQLIKRGLAELACDVAVERGDFDRAFALAEKACKQKMPEIHLAHAMALEDQGKFDLAEQEFITARKPREAIDMWIHQQQWNEATRVAQDFDPGAIGEIVEAQAKVLREAGDYAGAEVLYVQSKKAPEAVRMYQSINQFDEAARVAKQHAPRMLQQIATEKSQHIAQTANTDTLDYLLNQAKLCAAKREFSQAIDHYLSINLSHCRDPAVLESHWSTAADLAHDNVPMRVTSVTEAIAQKLIALDRHESASAFYVDAHLYQQAIDCLVTAKEWNKAKALASAHAPQLSAYVANQHANSLLSNNNLTNLAQVSPEMAIEAYVNSGEWDQVHSLASKQGEAMVYKYASLHAAALLKQAKPRSAVRVLLQYGCPILPANFPLYKRIALDVLASGGNCENPAASNRRCTATDSFSAHAQAVFGELRQMLAGLMRELHAVDPTGSGLTRELDQLLMITHFAHLRFTANQQSVQPVLTRLSVALLRYTKILPVDKAFFDAGFACRASSQLGQAFVFFNRFIDVTDLMSDPDSGDIDNSDFLETDIPSPFDTPLPAQQFYSDELREEIREWVLEKAMSHDISQALATRACDKCGQATFEAALRCHRCQFDYEPCIVTGFPVSKGRKISCGKCEKSANKEDWNRLVARTKCCPWCSATAQPSY